MRKPYMAETESDIYYFLDYAPGGDLFHLI